MNYSRGGSKVSEMWTIFWLLTRESEMEISVVKGGKISNFKKGRIFHQFNLPNEMSKARPQFYNWRIIALEFFKSEIIFLFSKRTSKRKEKWNKFIFWSSCATTRSSRKCEWGKRTLRRFALLLYASYVSILHSQLAWVYKNSSLMNI
jgi:hypothetical protein